MICDNCGETAQKQKWKKSKPSEKFCENCLPHGTEESHVTFVMIDENEE